MRPTDEEIQEKYYTMPTNKAGGEQEKAQWEQANCERLKQQEAAKWARDFDPWYYVEDGDLPELYEDENGQIKSDYVWVKCTDGEYDEASLRKPSNLNMFWDFINDHEINGEVTDIADDVYKVKCWMYPIEPKR